MADHRTRKDQGTLKRRDMLKAMTAVPAALLPVTSLASAAPTTAASMPAMGAKAAAQAAASATYQPKVLDPHEWKTVTVLSDIIIPADERSGSATQAKVPEFIDDWLDFEGGGSRRHRGAGGSELLAEIRGGLTWLDVECNRQFGHDFVDCSAAGQKEILDRIAYPKTAAPEDAPGVAFFNQLRGLVVTGFFSSEMGVKDLPYLGNQMVADWEGCPANVLSKLGFSASGKKG